MARLKQKLGGGRRLVATLALLSALVLVAAGCGGGGGGGPDVGPGGPEIPIVPADDHGDTRADATALALGGSVRGQIEEGDDEDYFRVRVTEAGTLTVYTTGALDTVGELQANDGSILASDDDSGDEHNFRIEHAVDPGTYYVKVNSHGTATGSYVVLASFTADELPPPPPADDHGDTRGDASNLALGGSVQGRIEEGDDDDFFRVRVTEAGTLTVYTTGALDTVGELQAGDGSRLASDDDSGDEHNFRIERDVGPGTYYVKVNSYDTATGSYAVLASFVADELPPPPPLDDHGDTRADATDLALGSTVRGQIEEGDDDDFFRVRVTEAGTLTVYTTGSLDTVGELQAGDGSVLASDDDGGDEHNFRIERDVGPGTYYIRVSSYGQEIGGYTVLSSVEADRSDTIAGATDIPVGSSISERIDRPNDVDYFRLRIAHTGTLTVWTTGEVATGLSLVDSAGNELRAASASASAPGGLLALSSGRPSVRSTGSGQNIASKELAVRAGTTLFAKVTGQRIGSYTFGSRNVRAGITNVVEGPRLSLSAGKENRVDLTAHFDTSRATGQLTYSATFDRPLIVGGVPLGVAITVEGSILTIVGQESGPAYSGTIGIKVVVSDPFGVFAQKVLDIEFTREAAPEPPDDVQGCVSAQVTRNEAYCSVVDKRWKFSAEVTNSCDRILEVRYQWSKFSDGGSPSDFARSVGPGVTTSVVSTACMNETATFRYCAEERGAYPSRCYGDNPAWRPPQSH